jgi:hypothetical protein
MNDSSKKRHDQRQASLHDAWVLDQQLVLKNRSIRKGLDGGHLETIEKIPWIIMSSQQTDILSYNEWRKNGDQACSHGGRQAGDAQLGAALHHPHAEEIQLSGSEASWWRIERLESAVSWRNTPCVWLLLLMMQKNESISCCCCCR